MKYVFLIACFVALLFGCGRQTSSDLEYANWEECVFVPMIYPYAGNNTPDTAALSFWKWGEKKQMKLIALIYGDCGSCFAQLEQWQTYLDYYKKEYEQIPFAAVVYTDNLLILEYNLEKLNSPLPIYIDTMRYFIQSNNLTETDQCYALLDSTNRVLYSTIGEKTAERKVHKKMMKIINRYEKTGK